MNTLIAALLLGAVSFVSANNLRVNTSSTRDLQGDGVFVAQDGLVVMEAESVQIVEPWRFETDVAGYTGSGYYRFDGNTVSSGRPLGTLSYKFHIDVPGTYHMRLRARKNNKESPTWSNDCYVKMVGHRGFRGDNVRAALGGLVKVDVWATRIDHMYGSPLTIETPRYELATPGVYELQVSGRTKNFVLDRVILYHVDMVTDFYAREAARPESPQTTGGTLAPAPATTTSPVMAPSPLLTSKIGSLDLVAAGTSNVLASLKDGEVVDQLKVGTSLSIIANIVGNVDSVDFKYNGVTWREGLAPYAMAGNVGSNNFPVDYLSFGGKKTLTIEVSVANTIVESLTLNFAIDDTPETKALTSSPTASPDAGSPVAKPTKSPVATPTNSPVQITGSPVSLPKLPTILFFLTTARLPVDTVIQELQSGDVLNRSETGTWVSIEASCPEVPSISKITFRYGNIGHVESLAPYLMGGNNGPKNTPVNYLKTTGPKQVSAKVYDNRGAVVAERTIDFTIIV